jgi:hypothetical protein
MKQEDEYHLESSLRIYRLFGLRIGSTYPFKGHLIEDTAVPDIVFNRVYGPPLHFDCQGNVPLYEDKKTVDESPVLSIHCHKDHIILRFLKMDFYVGPESIDVHLRDSSGDYLLEIWLLGRVLPLCLELRGVPCLHASSVVVNREAIGFLSSSHGGKSVLAASLMKAGYPLLTDDILPVRRVGEVFQGMPGNPSMRMWPDQAKYFLGSYEQLDLVDPSYSKRLVPVGPGDFGTFCSEAQPLKVLYIPEKQSSGDEIVIEPITPSDAFFEMVKNSFTARIVEALGLQPQRMSFFADMASQIPLRRLRYPKGFHYLSRVSDAILEDFESL